MPIIQENLDAPGDVTTPYDISPNDSAIGELSSDSDTDWFQITLTAGSGYFFQVNGDGTPTSISGSEISLRNENGEEVATGDSRMTGAFVTLSPIEDGTYYVQVGTNERFGDADAGTYRLDTIREIASGVVTDQNLRVGNSLSSTLEHSDDTDWVRVQLEAGRGYFFQLNGDGTATSISGSEISLLDENGEEVDVGDDRETGAFVTLSPTEDGTFYIQVGTNERFGDADAGTYRLDTTREIASGVITDRNLNIGNSLSSTLEHDDDTDWVRVQLNAGKGYIFQVSGDGTATSISGSEISLRNENGEEIVVGDSRQTGALVAWSPIEDGTYYVSVGTNERFGDADAGTYRLNSVREIAAGAQTDARLAVGNTRQSELEHSSDSDWFRARLSQGEQYAVLVEGDGTGSAISDVYLVVRDDNGESLIVGNSSNASSGITFATDYTGVHYVQVGLADSSFEGLAGTYEVSVFNDFGGTTDSARRTDLGERVESRIDWGADIDGFTTELTANQTYEVRVSGVGLEDAVNRVRLEAWLPDGFRALDTVEVQGDTLLYEYVASRDGDHAFFVGNFGNGSVRGVGDFAYTIAPLVDGTSEDERLSGTRGAEAIHGKGGNDTVLGRSGDDLIYGESGRDTLRGGGGDDQVFGGAGNDRIAGEAGGDILFGDSGNDLISGDGGNDEVFGGAGRDILIGGGGRDILNGGGGPDIFNGGAGNDTLVGGRGTDTFVFVRTFGNDSIRDFRGGDIIDLSDVAPITSFRDMARDHLEEVGNNLIINAGPNSIRLINVEIDDLSRDQFEF